MHAKPGAKKYTAKLTKETKQSCNTKNVNDIIKKIADVHLEADKKLQEIANYCFDKQCKVK
jgi:hypothetical protein